MIAFYLVILPATLIRMFVVAKKEGDHKTMNTLFKPLTNDYRPGCEWFEFVRLLFKFGFVLVRDTFRLSSHGKIAFLCLLFSLLI
jgi:uncharacterized membrane protein